jgi:tRNA-binding protein
MHCYHGQDTPAADPIAFDEFLKVKVDSRVGRIVTAEPFSEAWKTAFRLLIDFGPTIGLRSSANWRTGWDSNPR